jgi:ribosomal protein S18 acetylase RimI-like enzyme
MKIIIRKTNTKDIENIYNLHIKCFNKSDQWYKYIISNHINNGIIAEVQDTGNIVGILLQGDVIACSDKPTFFFEGSYNEDIFDPINDEGIEFKNNNLHKKKHSGIIMICIDPDYRNKGLGKKLIKHHINENTDKILCLHTRESNINAINLYKSMEYKQIGIIKNKYFLPNESSCFMIKNNI